MPTLRPIPIIVALVAASALRVPAQVKQPLVRDPIGQPVDQRAATTNTPSIRLDGPIGVLRVMGWAHDSVALSGTIAELHQLTGGVTKDGTAARFVVDVVPVKTPLSIVGKVAGVVASKGSSLELRVPRNARVWIKTTSGGVTVSGVDGGVDVSVVGGTVQVSGTPRQLNVEAMEAAVTIDATAEWLRVKTADGNILMNGSSRDASLVSISGTIRVGEGVFERAHLETVSGGIAFSGEPARGAAIDFNTHNGPIELWLPTRTKGGARVEATSIAGTIADSITNVRPSADARGQSLFTTYGFQMGVIVIQTYKGSIVLRPR